MTSPQVLSVGVIILMMAVFVGVVVLVGITMGFGGALVGALVSGVALYRVGRSAASAR